MPGLDPGILFAPAKKDRRDKPGDDGGWGVGLAMRRDGVGCRSSSPGKASLHCPQSPVGYTCCDSAYMIEVLQAKAKRPEIAMITASSCQCSARLSLAKPTVV